MPNLAAYFAHAGWPAEQIEPGVWHSTFAGETGATYHLYVLAADDWLHLAVSPLLRGESTGGTDQLYVALLRANQKLRLARLALDADGDINLLADLPAAYVNATQFAQTLELLAEYANALAPQLRQAAAESNDSSS